jgi:hypothetical protein
MLKRLITVILCLYALTSFAQKVAAEYPRPDSTRTLDQLFNPNPGTIIPADNFYKYYLQTKTINPGDSVHTMWPATYEEFKKAFIALEVEDPLANLDLHLPSPAEMRNLAYGGYIAVSKGPVSMLYDQFSKEARAKRIYADLLKKERAAVRYNNVLITRITGIKDEDKIREFIDFCALPVQFILNSSDYEIYAAIMNCYEVFCMNVTDTLAPGE